MKWMCHGLSWRNPIDNRFSPHAFHLDKKVEVFAAEGSPDHRQIHLSPVFSWCASDFMLQQIIWAKGSTTRWLTSLLRAWADELNSIMLAVREEVGKSMWLRLKQCDELERMKIEIWEACGSGCDLQITWRPGQLKFNRFTATNHQFTLANQAYNNVDSTSMAQSWRNRKTAGDRG